jgi:hypothetical protein
VREIMFEGVAGAGKSFAIGNILYILGCRYPGIRILVTRKTRESLTDAFLQTWEDGVLLGSHPMLDGPARLNRHSYQFGNGTEMVCGGMDKPSKLYSTDWDIWYCQEAFEFTEDEWIRARRSLRNWGGSAALIARQRGDTNYPQIPFQILIGDTNPDAEDHWINVRFQTGKTERFTARHKDNPKHWDHETQTRSEDGQAYHDNLEAMKLSEENPGVVYRRLALGQWCSASGAVWENYDRAIHEVFRPELTSKRTEKDTDTTFARKLAAELALLLGIRWYFGSYDWGFTDPAVFQVWGVAEGKRMYRVAEIFRTGQTLEWWSKKVVDLHREFDLRAIVCDPSRPDAAVSFNDYIGVPQDGPMRIARPANNAKTTIGAGDMSGLDAVRVGFQAMPDGKPAILFLRDSLREGADQALIQRKRPWTTEMEIPSYVYLARDDGKPMKERTDERCSDHGCDALRYARSFVLDHDLTRPEQPVSYPPNSYGAALGHADMWRKARTQNLRGFNARR